MQTHSNRRHFLAGYFLPIIFAMPAVLPAQDISIEDFRIPETNYQSFLGSLSGAWNKPEQTLLNSSIGYLSNSTDSRNSSSAQISLNYIMNHFSEDYSFQLFLSSIGDASRSSTSSSQSYLTSASSGSRSQSSSSFVFLPGLNYSIYINPDRWYGYVEGSGSYSYNENRIEELETDIHDTLYSHTNRWEGSTGIGLGYGKMRDGSPIFGVLRIIDKLQEDSMLVRSLTKEEILRLTEIFAKRAEYIYSQERYVKYFMDDLFKELQSMGVLKNNAAPAYSVARAIEVLSEKIEQRLFGWRVQVGIQKTFDELKEYSDGGGVAGIYRSYDWNSRNLFHCSSEFGRALSLNLHLYSKLSIDIPDQDYKRKIDFNFNVIGFYQLGERIDASISYGITRTHSINEFDQDLFIRSLQTNLRASLRFYIENHVTFTVSAGYQDFEQNSFAPNSISNYTYKAPQVNFGLNYRIF